MVKLTTALPILLLAACRGGPHQHQPTGLLDPQGNVVLYVSNQSFAIDPVDIEVAIDGQVVVAEEFPVRDQHHNVPFRLRLAPGRHRFSATSRKGEATLTGAFVVDGKHWGALCYWYYPDTTRGTAPTPRKFSFVMRDEPIVFE
jgi:hypothetical protein